MPQQGDEQETLVSWFQREDIAVTVRAGCATRPSVEFMGAPSADATTRTSLSFRPAELTGREPDDFVGTNGDHLTFTGGVVRRSKVRSSSRRSPFSIPFV